MSVRPLFSGRRQNQWLARLSGKDGRSADERRGQQGPSPIRKRRRSIIDALLRLHTDRRVIRPMVARMGHIVIHHRCRQGWLAGPKPSLDVSSCLSGRQERSRPVRCPSEAPGLSGMSRIAEGSERVRSPHCANRTRAVLKLPKMHAPFAVIGITAKRTCT
jgi:hypothetical protein